MASLEETQSKETSGAPWLVKQQWKHFRHAFTQLLHRNEEKDVVVAVVSAAKSGEKYEKMSFSQMPSPSPHEAIGLGQN